MPETAVLRDPLMQADRWHLRHIRLMLLTGLAYFLAGRLGLALAVPPGYATVVWPPAGIALAATLLGGVWALPGVLVGSFLVNVGNGFDFTSATAIYQSVALPFGIALGSAAQAGFGAFLVRRTGAYPKQPASAGSVARFFIFGGAISCLVAASIGNAALVAAGRLPWDECLRSWAIWWGGDLVGIIVFGPIILSLGVSPKGQRARRTAPIGLVAGACCLATIALVWVDVASSQRTQKADFASVSQGLASHIESTVALGMDAVQGISGFFAADKKRGLAEFTALADRIAASGLGIQALEWIPNVSEAERVGFDQEMTREWKASFAIFERKDGKVVPPAPRDHFPVAYVTPLKGNEGAVGFDLASNPARNAALVKAAETGRLVATAGVELVQNNEMGILVFAPIYTNGPDIHSGLRGFALGVFSAPQMLRAALNASDMEDLDYWLIDETDGKPATLASNTNVAPANFALASNSLFAESESIGAHLTLKVADRQWAFHVAPKATYLAKRGDRSALLLLIGGLLLTALASGFTLVASERQHRLSDARERDLENQKFALDQHAIVSITDFEGRIIYANDRFCQISRFPRAHLIGANHSIVSSHVHDTAFYQDMWNVIRSGSVWNGEICNRNAAGELYWLASTVVPLRGNDGRIDRFIAICTDITARKGLEQELEASRSFLQSVADSMGEGIFTLDEEGGCTFLNAEGERLIGWRFNEVRGLRLHDLVHYQDIDGNRVSDNGDIVSQLLDRRKYHSETQFFTHKDGRILPVSFVAVRLEEHGKPAGAVVVFQDITERRRVQEELVKSEQRLSIALSASSTGLWDYNPIAEEAIYSDTWFRMLGYEPKPGRHTGKVFRSLLHPDDFAAYEHTLTQHMNGVTPAVEVEFRMRRADGEWAWIRSIGKIIERDHRGLPQRLIGVHIDTTGAHQVQQELADAKDIAIRASQAKSDFLATMSHEIRTPMNAIIGLSHLMARTEMTPRHRDYLTKIQNASHALLAIINDILDFSKIEAGKLNLESVEFHLEDMLENVITVIQPKVSEKGLKLVVEKAQVLPGDFIGDPLRLSQLLMNLLSNAAKFTSAGEIRLKLGGETLEDNRFLLEAAVTDSGIGMSEAQMASLFRPFTQADASTSRRFGGTGLGLAICRQILNQMGGDISVASQEGEGTTFTFHVPLQLAPSVQLAEREAAALRGRRVLVIDDSKSARHIVRAALSEFGLEVTEAKTGDEGLERLAAEPFDVVLLDWKLPEYDGLEAVARMRDRGLLAPVVMLTAYGRRELQAALYDRFGDTPPVQAVIEKPVSSRLLKDNLLAAFGEGVGFSATPNRANLRASDVILPDVRILLVEDNPINQQVATELLEALGVETTVASSGEEALEILATRQFDVILMDIQMPGKDGLETTVVIRTEIGDTHTPIIAMTANAMSGDRERCLEAGMNDHVGKPIDPDALALTLARWVAVAQRPAQRKREEALKGESQASSLPSWPGVDVAAALRNLNGNSELLSELLVVFVEEHAEQAAILRGEAELGEWKRVNAIAHGLKGASATLGAVHVADASRDIEAEARNPVPSAQYIFDRIESLRIALREVVSGLNSEADAIESSPVAGSKDVAVTTDALPAIDRLLRMLREGNADAETESEKLAARLAPTALGDRAANVAAAAGRYDFDSAADALEKLREEVAAWA